MTDIYASHIENSGGGNVERVRGKYAKQLTAPLSVQVEITSDCNARCVHCYNTWQIGEKTKHSLTEEQADEIINQLSSIGIFHVLITGGEPLLKKDIVYYFLEKLNQHGISVSLNSNVMMLTPEVASKLKKSGLKSILTSLISYDEKTHDLVTGKKGNFKRVILGIQNALKENISISANMVLTKYNHNMVLDTGYFLNNLGVKGFCVTKGSWPAYVENYSSYAASKDDVIRSLHELVRLKNDLGMNVDILECYPLCFLAEDKSFSIFSNHKCTAGITSSTIGADGQVRPCSHAHMTYGNIFNESFSEIWKRMNERRTGELLPEKCFSCEYLSKCSGGCRMEACGEGDIKGLDPFVKIDNLNKIPELLDNRKIKIEELKGKHLKVNQAISFREEKDGCLISLGYGPTMVTHDTGKLLKILLNRDSFDISSISKEFNIDQVILNRFFFMLVKSNYIQIIQN